MLLGRPKITTTLPMGSGGSHNYSTKVTTTSPILHHRVFLDFRLPWFYKKYICYSSWSFSQNPFPFFISKTFPSVRWLSFWNSVFWFWKPLSENLRPRLHRSSPISFCPRNLQLLRPTQNYSSLKPFLVFRILVFSNQSQIIRCQNNVSVEGYQPFSDQG